jgi:hypothetical protein
MMHLALLMAAAQPPQMLGVGTQSCGSFVQTKEQPMSRAVFMQWLQGFLSHYDISNSDGIADATARTDLNGLSAWLDRYCAANPLLPFGTAADALLLQLKQEDRRARDAR